MTVSTADRSAGRLVLSLTLAAVGTLAVGADVGAQTRMPSTLRYGSGYLDVPAASVIPHLTFLATYSSLLVDTDFAFITDEDGEPIRLARDPRREFFADGSITLGLFDRFEVGTTLQHFGPSDEGGDMWGAFGRVAVLDPEEQGIGFALGARYVTGPDWDDGVGYQPPRLGFPDRRFRSDLPDGGDDDPDDRVRTKATVYGVSTLFLQGADSRWLPRHDLAFSLGWGGGMFKNGEKQDWYRFVDSEGWFAAAGVQLELTPEALLHVMGEWNGFDLNLGAQFDFGGIRVGGHFLAANHLSDAGVYRSPKWGALASLAICPPAGTWLCKPRLAERRSADTVRLPAPPPDTVLVPAPPDTVRVPAAAPGPASGPAHRNGGVGAPAEDPFRPPAAPRRPSTAPPEPS